jgi:phosphoribosyl 1,2-cyclic phosphodiesterase
MRSWVLGTGSHGNAVVIESERSRVLIDAGLPIRSLVRRLARIGIAPDEIEAVVLTHEHADHARAALAGARAFGWRIFATSGTVAGHADLKAAGTEGIRPGDPLALSTMEIETIPVPHDALAPVAVVATARRSGIRTGVAYDLGRATDVVRRGLAQLDVLIVESNHDDVLLRTGPYPRSVANRIAGPHGHLSNVDAAQLVAAVAHRGLERIVLAHLSAHCNEPALALRTMASIVRRGAARGAALSVATQAEIAGPFGPGEADGVVQLALGI